MKYPINREFWPFSRMVIPTMPPAVTGFMGSLMRAPLWLKGDPALRCKKLFAASADGERVPMLLLSPKHAEGKLPCLVYYHGGGFFFGAAGYHYRLAKRYALQVGCRVLFVQYRLAPAHPHPIPAEDCYGALRFAFENAEEMGVDSGRIAVAGDSAGGALAAAVCQMARDRGTKAPLFQLLVYPVTDRRMDTESNRCFTDTPMWNSKSSVQMWRGYLPQGAQSELLAYASPMEAQRFDALPSAYVETAEFDCLHDEGANYAAALRAAGVAVQLNETKGTMHGFDIVQWAPTAKAAVSTRIAYMKAAFAQVRSE